MRYYQSLGAYLPEIKAHTAVGQNLEWNTRRINPPPGTGSREYRFASATNVQASYLLFDGFARTLNVLIRKRELVREDAVKMQVYCMVRRLVAYAYADMQLASALQEIADDDRRFELECMNYVKALYDKNQRPRDEMLNFEIMAGFATADVIAASYSYDTADYALAQMLGLPVGKLPDGVRVSNAEIRLCPLPYDEETLIRLALANSPDMHVMEQTLKIAEYEKYKSYSTDAPTVTAYTGFGYNTWNSQTRGLPAGHHTFNSLDYQYGVEASYLIFNGFARYNKMREVQAAFAAAEFDMAQTYLELVNKIRAACADYNRALGLAEVYKAQYLATTEQRAEVVLRYKNHKSSVDRVNSTQRNYLDARTQYVKQLNVLRKTIALIEAIIMESLFPEELPYVDAESLNRNGSAQ